MNTGTSDRYPLKRLLGEGSKKRVHLALDTHLDREVALAFVKTDGLDEAGVERVREEARALARLGEHPHIVTIHDILEENGQVILVTEYLDGGDLEAVIAGAEGHRLPLERTLRIGDHLAQALEHAHARGVLHRDLNPANVWLSASGTAKLGDFGLAVSLARSRMVREGLLVTAVAYMAPEQALGRAADERCDLYSLGAVLYELTTGRPPFLGDDAISVLSQHIYTAPVAPSWHDPTIPPSLEALILRLLAKLPEQRPPSAAAVREVLAVIAAAEANGNAATPRAEPNPLDRLAAGVFVGRETVMAELRAGVEEAFTGRGRCFMLTGEPGIGKTRCAEEIGTYARLRNAHVLVGRCVEGEGAPAYWPWLQILRELASADELDRIFPELAGSERERAEISGADPLQLRFQLFDNVARFLIREAQTRPLLLVLDDLHRADTPSLLLLQHLVREIVGTRVVVVGTYRDVEVDAAHPLASVLAEIAPSCREIELHGLAPEGLARFIEITTGSAAPAPMVEEIHKLTRGNPLFATELVRLRVVEGDAADRPTLSLGIRHTIGRRLERLSDATRTVLGVASVLGREFELDLLERACPDPPLMESIDEALETRTLEAQGDGFRFTHVLIRDALYEGLPSLERRRCHRAIGEAIEACRGERLAPHLARLAHHFFEAGVADKAVDYAARAGDHAAGQLAYEEAAAHYALALQAVDRGSQPLRKRAEILAALGEVHWSAGETARARKAFLETAELARKLDASDLMARSAFGFTGRTDATLDVDYTAVELMEEALAAMPNEDGTLRAELTARLATALYFSPQREKQESLARDAVAMAERLGATSTLAYTLNALHYVLWRPGNAHERLALADRQLTLGRLSGSQDVVALGHYARLVDLLELGDVSGANAEIDAYARTARKLHQPFFGWQSCALRATRALLSGSLEEAERLIHEALEHGQRAQSPNALAMFGGQLFFLRREQGRIGELGDAIRSLVDENPSVPAFRYALAYLLAEDDRDQEAAALFERLAERDFEDVPFNMQWPEVMWLATHTCARLGDRARAATLYEQLAGHAGHCLAMGFAIAWGGAVSYCLGILATLLSDFSGAEEHFKSALIVHRRAGARPLLAHTQREFATMLLERGASGDRERAARLLAEARASYRELGMASWAERAEVGLGSEPAPPEESAGRFASEGGEWSLTFAGTTVRVRDARGLQYLARLLETPHQEVHVTELVASAEGQAPEARTEAAGEGLRLVRAERGMPRLDERARATYQARLTELREEVADAERLNDLGRGARARHETELLEAEITSAFGLSGRARRTGDAVERARKAVSNRIRDAIRRIEPLHPRLGRHLSASIRTGTYCAYQPELPVRWER